MKKYIRKMFDEALKRIEREKQLDAEAIERVKKLLRDQKSTRHPAK